MNKYVILFASLFTVFVSCKKNEIQADSDVAVINVINAIASQDAPVKINFSGLADAYWGVEPLRFFSYDGAYSNGRSQFGVKLNKETPLKIVLGKDTLKTIFEKKVNFTSPLSLSVFLVGIESNLESFTIEDNLKTIEDEVVNVRFVNVSPDEHAVSVNLRGEAHGSLIPRLKFKEYTDFKSFSAKEVGQFYVFEIRDADTENLLAEFYYDNLPRFRNELLLIRGTTIGNGPSLHMTRIKY